jgi:serine/threonine-protein kinase
LVPLPDPILGRTIGGRYLVEEKVGEGGMGTVYRARHEVVGRDVAIKFLSPELATDRAHRTRFLREARAANRINHEHIIDITDFGETDDGLVYLVMEFLVGTPINDVIRSGPIDPMRVLRIALQAARALGRAHELDVVHRDIKPENVYLLHGYEGDFVKILDFGLAHMKGELRVTATGIVFGTPEYMAPEQAKGKAPTASADLYSLGCMLYEMLTGQLPFEGQGTGMLLKHMREPARPPSLVVPSIPAEVDALVLRLLEKEPEERFATAYDLASELERLRRVLSGASPSEGPGTSIPPPSPGSQAASGLALNLSVAAPGSAKVEAWERRLELFRDLVARAHPGGPPPPWLASGLERLAHRIAELKEAGTKLGSRASEATRQEDEVRDLRLRLGRAIDALAADEAGVLGRINEVRRRIASLEAGRDGLQSALSASWRSLPPPPRGKDLPLDSVVRLRDTGALAGRWLEEQQAIEEAKAELPPLERERDDLRFQLGQLKGRLATISAESDYQVDGLKKETLQLGHDVQDRQDAVLREAEPIVRYLMGFPELRPLVVAKAG